MKIVFFSHDDELEEFLQDAQTSADVVMTDTYKDAVAEVEDALDEELPVALFLDFDTSRKDSEKLNKEYLKNKEVSRIVFTESMSVKELKKHQDSKLGAHAYMRKPLGAEAISELLQDLRIADEAVFEFESDDLFDSIPVGSDTTTHDDEDSSSQSGVDFSAAEMKMDTQVRYQLDRHNVQSDKGFDFKNETNVRIQAIFDSVLGDVSSVHDEIDETQDDDNYEFETNLADDGEESAAVADEAESIVFDFADNADSEILDAPDGKLMSKQEDGQDEESTFDVLEQMESEREASLVGYRPPSLEATGDIEIPDEFRTEGVQSSDESEDLLASIDEGEEDEALDFTGGDDEGALEFGMPAEEDGAGLSLGADDGEELDLGANEAQEEVAADAGGDQGMDLAMDEDDGALEFSGAEDLADSQDDQESAAEEVGGLDLGDDAGELELGSEESDDNADVLMQSGDDADDDFGALDLSESDDDEVEKTVVMSADDGALNFDMGASEEADADQERMDTADIDFSSDLSESDIDSGDEESLVAGAEDVNLDDALTGVTEEGLEEFDYTGANLDASDELGEEDFSDLGDMGEGIGETTDPTMLASVVEDEATLSEFNDFNAGVSTDDVGDSDNDMLGASELDGEEDLLGASEDEEDFDDDLLAQGSDPEPAPTKASATTGHSRPASDPILVQTYAQEEMVRHQGLIKQLREEREDLLKQITDLKTSVRLSESENLGLRAELDELKIEKSIMKKRAQQDLEEMRYGLKLADEKREIFEERARKVQKEFDKLNHKVRIDFNTVKQREKELEGQLELLKMDSRSQVESRDKKILELKRKIDALEFNMENAHIKEQKSKEDKVKLEEKLHKVMKTLRSSIKVMEDDLEIDNLLGEAYDPNNEGEASE